MTSEDVREELARIAPVRRCDRLAELSAFFRSAGNLHLRGKGEWALHLDLASGASARRAFALLRDEGIRSEIRTYVRRAFDRSTRYQLHVSGSRSALDVLVAAGVLDRLGAPIDRPPARVVRRACCRAAYLRGAFLGAGSLSVRHGAHVELRAASFEPAAFLVETAARSDIALGVVERSSHAAAVGKSWDVVESLFAFVGASETVLALEERAVLAGARAHANRLANADHANLVRTTRSAYVQLQAARRLRADGRLQKLSAPLREAAELRLRHPADSLRELARRADPPASKAAMHRRLRRLEELATG